MRLEFVGLSKGDNDGGWWTSNYASCSVIVVVSDCWSCKATMAIGRDIASTDHISEYIQNDIMTHHDTL